MELTSNSPGLVYIYLFVFLLVLNGYQFNVDDRLFRELCQKKQVTITAAITELVQASV